MSSTAKWAELIAFVPRSAVLTETDGPFVKVSGRPAVPADVERVIAWLADTWKVSLAQATQQVADNLDRLVKDLEFNAA
jgi:TatD DNase family protein